MPQIEVTFDIDANGIVNVTAKDKATNKEQQIRIQASGGLSETDINRMVKDAEAHAPRTSGGAKSVDAKNHGESLVHDAEKALKEYGDKVAQSDRSAVEAAIAALKAALQGEDVEAIKARTNDLMQAQMKLGEAMYKAQQAPARRRRGRRAGRRKAEGRRHRRRVPRSRRRQEEVGMTARAGGRRRLRLRDRRPPGGRGAARAIDASRPEHFKVEQFGRRQK